ncbi:hypothetical protein FK216_11950 [Moraxellaceae bacterium AER2_44_116]|nr:hypothetical protein FK216_11950 [Moraxellaceae bacterium AER2_44_116]
MELTPLAPLQASTAYWDEASASSIENELKQLFIALFQQSLRTQFRRIDHFGYPHLLDEPDFETVQRFIKLEGLSLLNRETDNQPYMREVFRAWRGQHPRRGLGFLAFYLQMLWPNAWQITQYWHSVATVSSYPSNIVTHEAEGSFLTSRVAVTLDPDQITNPSELVKMIPALKRVVPARIVLNVAMGVDVDPIYLEVGMAFSPMVCLTFEDGTL